MMPDASSVYSSNVRELYDPSGIADVFVNFPINVYPVGINRVEPASESRQWKEIIQNFKISRRFPCHGLVGSLRRFFISLYFSKFAFKNCIAFCSIGIVILWPLSGSSNTVNDFSSLNLMVSQKALYIGTGVPASWAPHARNIFLGGINGTTWSQSIPDWSIPWI